MKKVEEVIQFGINHPDTYYKKKYIGTIRFQGRFVKISENFGFFMTANSFESFPENIKVVYSFLKSPQINI